jgi:hypothetical protein
VPYSNVTVMLLPLALTVPLKMALVLLTPVAEFVVSVGVPTAIVSTWVAEVIVLGAVLAAVIVGDPPSESA